MLATNTDPSQGNTRGIGIDDFKFDDTKPQNFIISYGCQPGQGVQEDSNFVKSFMYAITKNQEEYG